MNDIAARVAELPAKYRGVYSASLAFSPDGRLLADEAETTPQGEVVHIWDWREKRIVKTLLEPLGGERSNRWNSLLFVNGFLAMCVGVGGSEYTRVRVWNAKDWSVAADLNESWGGVCVAIGALAGEKGVVYANSRLGVLGGPGISTDSELVAHAVGTWKESWRLTLSIHPEAMAISPNGSLAAVTGVKVIGAPGQPAIFERHLVLVDLSQHQVARDIPTSVAGCVAWSSDGARIMMTNGGEVEIVNATSGASLYKQSLGNRNAPRGILYDPKGRYLMEYDWNGRGEGSGVRIWDATREHLLQHIAVGDAGAAAMSRDGKYLAVGETGQTTVWQLK